MLTVSEMEGAVADLLRGRCTEATMQYLVTAEPEGLLRMQAALRAARAVVAASTRSDAIVAASPRPHAEAVQCAPRPFAVTASGPSTTTIVPSTTTMVLPACHAQQQWLDAGHSALGQLSGKLQEIRDHLVGFHLFMVFYIVLCVGGDPNKERPYNSQATRLAEQVCFQGYECKATLAVDKAAGNGKESKERKEAGAPMRHLVKANLAAKASGTGPRVVKQAGETADEAVARIVGDERLVDPACVRVFTAMGLLDDCRRPTEATKQFIGSGGRVGGGDGGGGLGSFAAAAAIGAAVAGFGFTAAQGPMRQILREELGGAASTVAVALGDAAEMLGAVKKAVDEVGEMQEIHSASMNDGFDRIQERANEAAKGRTDAEAVLHSSMGRMEQRMETLAAA